MLRRQIAFPPDQSVFKSRPLSCGSSQARVENGKLKGFLWWKHL